MQEKLSLDNELLKPIKQRLEQSIDVLTKMQFLQEKNQKLH